MIGESTVKALILVTGDHHSGPEYERCILVPTQTEVENWVDQFRTRYPFRCPSHPYDDDHPGWCEDCERVIDETRVALRENGLQEDGRGFWNQTFADWLVKVKQVTEVSFEEVCV